MDAIRCPLFSARMSLGLDLNIRRCHKSGPVSLGVYLRFCTHCSVLLSLFHLAVNESIKTLFLVSIDRNLLSVFQNSAPHPAVFGKEGLTELLGILGYQIKGKINLELNKKKKSEERATPFLKTLLSEEKGFVLCRVVCLGMLCNVHSFKTHVSTNI